MKDLIWLIAGYFIWAFAPYLGSLFSFITPSMSEWAFRLPVVLAVYVILLIVLWIGYTMSTTPPPVPLENPLSLKRNLGDINQKKQESLE